MRRMQRLKLALGFRQGITRRRSVAIHGVQYQPWSLRFTEPALEARFEEHHFHQNWQHMRIALLVSVLVFLLVSLLDYVLLGEISYHALGVRILSYVPLVVVLLLLSYTKHWRLIFAASPFAVAIAGLTLVMPLAPHSLYTNTLYFVAMLLFMFFAYGVMRARFLWVVRAGLAITLGYQLTLLLVAPIANDVFISRTIMLIVANIIGIFAAYTVEYFARRDFVQTVLMTDSADSLALSISQRNQHLRHFINASQDTMLFRLGAPSPKGEITIIEHHPKLSEWLYISSDEAGSLSDWLGHAKNGSRLVSEIEHVVTQGQEKEFIVEISDNDQVAGSYKLLIVGAPTDSRHNQLALGILIDQTEEVAARAKQKELLEQKTKFLDITGHQLNTPLSMMRWALEEIRTDTSGTSRTQLLDGMQHAVDRMARTLTDVFTALSVARGQYDIVPGPFTIQDLIEELRERSSTEHWARLRIHISRETRAAKMQGDFTKLLFVFERLLENALDYSDHNVDWFLERRGSCVWSSVHDQGFGIAPSDLPHVFQLFYRGQQAVQAKPDKTGLSLYVARHYVEAHQGIIRIAESRPGETIITVEIPGLLTKKRSE